jgi:hypothetical protein
MEDLDMSDAKKTLAQRKALVASIPWVTMLKTKRPCDGVRWSHVPMKAISWWGPKRCNPPIGLDSYRCKKQGYLKFRALKNSYAKDGVYCWDHLLSSGLYHGMDEESRFKRWYTKNHPESTTS